MSFNADTPLAEWLAWLEQLHPLEIDLGLQRVQQVFDVLNPEFNNTRVITIAGTNGKGSCAAMLEAIFLQAELNVGVYTSPHLLRFNERIRINGVEASDSTITAALANVEAVRNDVSLTYFEYTTLAALQCFANANVDVMVLEVGLGGRLDAVNIIDSDVALITTVDLDHQSWLGDTRDEIGREKAGILRSDRPAVIADPAMPHSVIDYADEIGANVSLAGRDFLYSIDEQQWYWTHVELGTVDALPILDLPGEHQYQNAAAVIEVIHQLPDIAVTDVDVIAGLGNISIVGRGQQLAEMPNWRFDVAHNPQAIEALAQTLSDEKHLGRRHAICSMLDDKDIETALKPMLLCVDTWWIFDLQQPRAAKVERLVAAIQTQDSHASINIFPDADALLAAIASNVESQDEVVVFGSFLTVAQIMQPCI